MCCFGDKLVANRTEVVQHCVSENTLLSPRASTDSEFYTASPYLRLVCLRKERLSLKTDKSSRQKLFGFILSS